MTYTVLWQEDSLLIPLNLETAIRRCNPHAVSAALASVRSWGEYSVEVVRPHQSGQGAAMPFSSKAQEIHNHIVRIGKADYWIGVARSLAERSGQHQPRKPYTHNISCA